MGKFYGNLTNRFEEGINRTGREIRPGDDITMYLWSDRHCYYVTDVIDQKRIKVRRYYTCADHSKSGGMGHQDWLYFKTYNEMNKYLVSAMPGVIQPFTMEEPKEPETWVFRYGKWVLECTHDEMEYPEECNKRERAQFEKTGHWASYHDLSGKVSFGVRDHYYDWEF